MRLVGWILLAVFVILILLIFFVPYGIDVQYAEDVLRLSVKAGPITVKLLPKKPLTPAQEKAKAEKKTRRAEGKKTKKQKKSEAKEKDDTLKLKKKRKLDFDTILALLRMGAHAIRRFFRSFTIDLFSLHYTAAARDPYDTAMQYSYICAGVEALPALCGNVIRVRKKDIVIGNDFLADSPSAEGRIVLTLQLFRLVHLAFALVFEFISWKIKSSRDGAGSSERTDDNGRKQDQ